MLRASFLFLFLIFSCVCAKKLPDIYWNSTNAIFDISNTDHVKQVQLLDRVTIICPRPAPVDEYEFSKLFVVSREEYESCELRSTDRLLGICATPDRQSSISVVFRDFSPLPSAIEFHPGQSYFVIATSNGSESGMNNTQSGLCLQRNMRLKFDVQRAGDSDDINSSPLSKIRDLNNRKPLDEKTKETTGNSISSRVSTFTEPITYIIHTVEPEHFTSAVNSASSSGLSTATDRDSALVHSPSVCLLLGVLFLLDLTWRRLL
ncbi:hypothetical protein M3Y94_00954800 [Aphelenchoides besseyi]|nr:hypothetical protein M3Y94_00954800 [Aphelenchoides besseyi]KAI6224782.1 hypothetical protein M3Y95_00788900 [Aphelenchoides besseyi]